MRTQLTALTEGDINARCTEASFDRGWGYFVNGAVRQRHRAEDGLETRVAGTHLYHVTVRETSSGLLTFCTCPYNWGGDCKHIVATLLAWLHEPESFQALEDLHAALSRRPKADLVAVLTDICTLYPHVADEFGLMGEWEDYDPDAVVKAIFSDMLPPGDISIDEAVARIETVARQAVRFAEQDHQALARRIYFALVCHTVEFCDQFGAGDIFPLHIPYDYATAYRDLALSQLDVQANLIQDEMQRLFRAEWALEAFGIEEPLLEVWEALGC
jgi:hypothetical protein